MAKVTTLEAGKKYSCSYMDDDGITQTSYFTVGVTGNINQANTWAQDCGANGGVISQVPTGRRIIRKVASRFDGDDVINADLLSEDFSNFRFLGIGKPSQKQIERWELKGKTAKIERLTAKGKIDASKLKTAPVSETETYTAPTSETKSVDTGGSSSESTPKKKFLGMPMGIGIAVTVVAVGVIGFIIYRKLKK
jgi:hypothetical protein